MPSSPLHAYQRNSSPKAETFPRSPNSAVAEAGVGKNGRKKGKNINQKITSKEENNVHAVAPVEVKAKPRPAAIVENVTETASEFSLPDVSGAASSAEHDLDPDVSFSNGRWMPPFQAAQSKPMNLLEDMSDETQTPSASAPKRGGFSSKTPPASPLPRKARPSSYSPGISSSPARRPIADVPFRMPSTNLDISSPPPPHLPQAHFYGAPDIDLGPANRIRPTCFEEEARLLCFAELPSPSGRRQKSNAQIVLLATKDRLDAVALVRGQLIALGTIEKIGGIIVEAKVLTWESGEDPFSHLRPLVALVVHGPRRSDIVPPARPGEASDPGQTTGEISTVGGQPPRREETIEYQTTVDIFSLANQERLATLLWSQPTSGCPSFRGIPAGAPRPVGGLRLDAGGNFLTVSSGTTGEIFVFGAENHSPCRFRCLGKFWTTIQTPNDRRYSNSSSSTDPDSSPADLDRGAGFSPLPIMSLSSRWLAIVPPGPASVQCLSVTISKDLISKGAPGLESRNAPPQPPVSCVVESPDAERFINRVARGVAQEVVRGARWLGGQGLQTWNSYWNKDQQGNTTAHTQNRNVQYGDTQFSIGAFPPTHAPESRAPPGEPQNVSIIDLQVLATESLASRSDTAAHVATFEPPHGISFLSFSPDGLFIASATRKGDVHYVWDLKQIKHLRAGMLLATYDAETSVRSAKVTQVARFARLTPTNIVDIQWHGPTGDRFAVITKNGTIHIFDLPFSAFQWPPIRRSPRVEPSSAPASPAVLAQSDEPTAVSGVLSSAMKLAGKTQPMLATLRGRAPSTGGSIAVPSGNNSIALASATGIRSSRAVAAGLSKSVGAATGTMNSLRHAGDNRLHLNSLAANPTRSHVCWAPSRHQPSLLVLDADYIRSFNVSKRRSSSKPRRQPVSIVETKPRLSLPIPASAQLSNLKATTKSDGYHQGGDDERTAAGYWTWPTLPRDMQSTRIIHPLSYAEIDTNAPYQPFHSDRRVTLSVYDERAVEGWTTTDNESWIFGHEIASTKLDIRAASVSDEEEQHTGESVLYRHTTSMTNFDEARLKQDQSRAEQIVVTTRRKKNKLHAPHHQAGLPGDASKPRMVMENDDGFFEDDCDVLDFAEDRV